MRRTRRRATIPAMCALAALQIACAGGMPKVPATPEAVIARADEFYAKGRTVQATALYQAFIERYAGHDRADYAQFMLGETHFKERDYELAAVEYQVLVTSYSYSEYVDDAMFQLGVCYWKESPKVQRDQQKSKDALGRFNQYLQTFPQGERVDEAKKYVREISERLAHKAFIAARWYYRQKNGRAAMVYCDMIIENYPDNEYWAEALVMKGNILARRGEKEEAIRQFTRVLEYPGDIRAKREAETRIREVRE